MRRRAEASALDVMEEALVVWRRQPMSTLAWYYVGAAPCVLGWLYFWADMSRGARAAERVAVEALILAALYLWMKVTQLGFVRGLRTDLIGKEDRGWSATEWLRAMAVQVVIQPWRLVVLPLAAVPLIPLAWALAFFENVTVLGAAKTDGMVSVCRRAWRQACLWPGQNQALKLLLLLSAGIVFLNIALVLFRVPQLLKSLLGVETVFSRSYWAYLNTTFLAVGGGLAFLIIDPLVKTAYVLRCFQGESLQSGEDLRAAFRRLASRARLGVGAMALMIGGLGVGDALGQSPEPIAPDRPARIEASALDRAIEQVMQRPIYEWRFPRDPEVEGEASKSVIGRWIETWLESLKFSLERARHWMGEVFRPVGDFLERLGRRLFGRGWRPTLPGGPIDLVGGMQLLLWLVLFLAVALGIAWGLRGWWKRDRPTPEPLTGPSAPNWLSDEVSAAELPQDEWVRMAEDFLQRGDRRLALRALYLGALAGLSKAGWITLARHRSNREYEVELRRRSRERPQVAAAFGTILGRFEPVWYGRHGASGESIDEVRGNLELIRTCVAQTQSH